MDTFEFKISLQPKFPWNEILIQELTKLGFDSFVEDENGILAYIQQDIDVKKLCDKTSLSESEQKGFTFSIEKNLIPQKNWNEEWEKGFHPVQVEDYATVIAPFHKGVVIKGMEIIIQPQMSFGTGHHQTTWLMTKALFELNHIPEDVLDVGTGTGILSIVSEKLGAKRILGTDIEEWAVENAKENARRNNCNHIEVRCGDIDVVKEEKFGLILANINKNVLLSHMENYVNLLENEGMLLLSGFFVTDVGELVADAQKHGLKSFLTEEKEG